MQNKPTDEELKKLRTDLRIMRSQFRETRDAAHYDTSKAQTLAGLGYAPIYSKAQKRKLRRKKNAT